MHGGRLDAERQPAAAALLRLQRKHQRRIVARSPAEIDLQCEAALVAFEIGEPHLSEVKAGVPHQRSVGIDPEVVAASVVTEHRKSRRLDHFIRQPPVRRPTRCPGALLPHRKHLRRQPQQRFFRVRHPGPEIRQMNECVRDQAGMLLLQVRRSFVMCHCRQRGANAKTSRGGFPACYSLMACPRFLGCSDANEIAA